METCKSWSTPNFCFILQTLHSIVVPWMALGSTGCAEIPLEGKVKVPRFFLEFGQDMLGFDR